MILGLGSGRCGTLSLAKVLGLSHEAMNLPWEVDEYRFEKAWRRIVGTRGDVSMGWLRYLDLVWSKDPSVRVLCLRRDRAETAASWAQQLESRDRFAIPCLYTDAAGQIVAPSIFPDYGDLPKAQAAATFWDTYYEQAETWQRLRPDRFRIFESPKVLNDPKAQRRMWLWLGRPKEPLRLGIREHRFQGRTPEESESKLLQARLNGWVMDRTAEALRGARAVPDRVEISRQLETAPHAMEWVRRIAVLRGMHPLDAARIQPKDVSLAIGSSID